MNSADLANDDQRPECENAGIMAKNELRVQLESRGITPTGFLQDDRTLLQAEFDKEHVAKLLEWDQTKKERAAKRALEEAEARRRLEAQQERLEEQQVRPL